MQTSRASGIAKEFAQAIFSYLPIILLWQFVPSDGSAADAHYVEAFRLFFFVAIGHLVLAINWIVPFDRLAMATDLWLVLCGAFAWVELWATLQWFAGHLRGTGIWVIAAPLCLHLAYRSQYGVICARTGNPNSIRRLSLVMVAAICAVLIYSYNVRSSVYLSVIFPTALLTYSMGRIKTALEGQTRKKVKPGASDKCGHN